MNSKEAGSPVQNIEPLAIRAAQRIRESREKFYQDNGLRGSTTDYYKWLAKTSTQ